MPFENTTTHACPHGSELTKTMLLLGQSSSTSSDTVMKTGTARSVSERLLSTA